MLMLRQRPPFRFQVAQRDCGPACALALCEFYGVEASLADLRRRLVQDPTVGTRVSDFRDNLTDLFSVEIGRQPTGAIGEHHLPFIAFLPARQHYVVAWEVSRGKVLVGDPGLGLVKLEFAELIEMWDGITIVLRPREGLACSDYSYLHPSPVRRLFVDVFHSHRVLCISLLVLATVMGAVSTAFSVLLPRFIGQSGLMVRAVAAFTSGSLLLSVVVSLLSALLTRNASILIGEEVRRVADRVDRRFYTPGDVYTRFHDVEDIVNTLVHTGKDIVYSTSLVVCILAYLWHVSWTADLAMVALTLAIALVAQPFLQRVRVGVFKLRLRMAALNDGVNSYWSGQAAAMGNVWGQLVDVAYRQAIWALPGSVMFGQLGLLSLLVVGIVPGGPNELLSRTLTLVFLTQLFAGAAHRLYHHYGRLQTVSSSVRRLGDFLETGDNTDDECYSETPAATER